MRIGIIGMGWVGASVAISTLHRGFARELWLHDVRPGLAAAEALDLAHGASYYAPCVVREASVAAMAQDCDAVVLAAGHGALPGKSRLDALASTAAIAHEVGQQLRGAAGVIVVVTNPVDVMTALVTHASGLPPERVLGTGTILDTMRLRHAIAQQLELDERSIHAHVLGEHGDSQVAAFSTAAIGGLPLRRMTGWRREEEAAMAAAVRRAAYAIIAGKGATNHAIGLVTAALLQCILRNERRVLTVSRLQPPSAEFTQLLGAGPVALSLPTIVGRDGGARILLPELDPDELTGLRHSADVLRTATQPHWQPA